MPYLSGSGIEHGIDEGHDGGLQVDLVSVASRAPVELVQQRLHSSERGGR